MVNPTGYAFRRETWSALLALPLTWLNVFCVGRNGVEYIGVIGTGNGTDELLEVTTFTVIASNHRLKLL